MRSPPLILKTSRNLSNGRIKGTMPDPQVIENGRAVDSAGFCTCLDVSVVGTNERAASNVNDRPPREDFCHVAERRM